MGNFACVIGTEVLSFLSVGKITMRVGGAIGANGNLLVTMRRKLA